MSLSSEFIIDKKKLGEIDCFYTNFENNVEDEINYLIDNFWPPDIGISNYCKPLLISHLNLSWLMRTYIVYNSILNIRKKYPKIKVKDSHYILDLCLDYFKIKKELTSNDHSKIYYLNDHLNWINNDKITLNFFFKIYKSLIVNNISILYLDAGKMKSDFKSIKDSFDAKYLVIKNHKFSKESEIIIERITKNIKNMNFSIPNEIILKLVKEKFLINLKQVLNTIGTYYDFIKLNKVKLVIVSTVSNDQHICLLIAAKLANIKSLILGHGHSGTKNIFLDDYATYQGKISNLEYSYKNTKQYEILHNWFHEKKI